MGQTMSSVRASWLAAQAVPWEGQWQLPCRSADGGKQPCRLKAEGRAGGATGLLEEGDVFLAFQGGLDSFS